MVAVVARQVEQRLLRRAGPVAFQAVAVAAVEVLVMGSTPALAALAQRGLS